VPALSPSAPRHAAPPTVLLLARTSRQEALARLLRTLHPGVRLVLTCSAVDAALLLPGSTVQLLVIDLKLAPGHALAFIHLLARLAPEAHVLAVNDEASQLPIRPYTVCCWENLASSLTAALDKLCHKLPH
jgi:DNA-binding NarL/FixJ family response regulator